jgi:FtsK/SpoIIIE family
VLLEFVRRDALAAIIPALPVPDRADLRALPVGRREDGLPWHVRLDGTLVLIAGSTGAGKASLLWGLVRAMLPLIRDGLVRVLAADPKLMELAYGRAIFDTYGAYAADPASIVDMLEQAVADMQARAAQFAGQQRDHTPTRIPPGMTSSSASWTPSSPRRESAGRPSRHVRRGGTARLGAARTPLTYPAARSVPARSARSTPRRTASPSGPRCSSP